MQSLAHTALAAGRTYVDPLVKAHSLLHRGFTRLLPGTRPAVFNGVLACALAALAYFVGGYTDLMDRPIVHRTVLGETLTIHLQDGSKVHIAPLTELRVQFLKRRRNVTLVQGEAFFEVAHDEARPFQVIADGSVVRAVGTSFNIRVRPGAQAEVLVEHGRVVILKESDARSRDIPADATPVSESEIVLLTAQRAQFVRRLSDSELQRKLAWRHGTLVFDGEPLGRIVEELNRYNHRQLVIEDPTLTQLPMGGTFKATDLEAFIDALPTIGITAVSQPGDDAGPIRLVKRDQ